MQSVPLIDLLPQDQQSRVFHQHLCDIGPEFLGFVAIYEHLAAIIPHSFTVVDLGCAYAPQAFLFKDHDAYIGVDLFDGERFTALNTTHYITSIEHFIRDHLHEFEQGNTFAICSYVPPWGADNMMIARSSFQNVFTYYPCYARPR